jgi:hypothetical protein
VLKDELSKLFNDLRSFAGLATELFVLVNIKYQLVPGGYKYFLELA